MELTTGTLMFFGGIAGMGISVAVGLVVFGMLQNGKKKIRNNLEKHYTDTNRYKR